MTRPAYGLDLSLTSAGLAHVTDEGTWADRARTGTAHGHEASRPHRSPMRSSQGGRRRGVPTVVVIEAVSLTPGQAVDPVAD